MRLASFLPGLAARCGPILLYTACEAGAPPPAPASAPSVPTPAPAEVAPATAPPAATGAAAAPALGTTTTAAAASGTRSASYGAAFAPGPTVALATLLTNPKAYAERSVITEGHVQRACSRRGCWMEIGEGENACRVTFKDYGFFVPTDSAGAQARVQGHIITQRVEPDRVRHLEGEGAKFKKREADGSATEVQFIASAVQLTRTGP